LQRNLLYDPVRIRMPDTRVGVLISPANQEIEDPEAGGGGVIYTIRLGKTFDLPLLSRPGATVPLELERMVAGDD
jgi:hypothetical protein